MECTKEQNHEALRVSALQLPIDSFLPLLWDNRLITNMIKKTKKLSSPEEVWWDVQ